MSIYSQNPKQKGGGWCAHNTCPTGEACPKPIQAEPQKREFYPGPPDLHWKPNEKLAAFFQGKP